MGQTNMVRSVLQPEQEQSRLPRHDRKLLNPGVMTLLVAAVLVGMVSLTAAQAHLRLSFEEMSLRPQLYSMKSVQVHGRVIDVQDANYEVTMRVNISARDFDFSENILVLYSRTRSDCRLFEGDVVNIRGVFRGLITYTGALGNR
jgi:hypothetical protein